MRCAPSTFSGLAFQIAALTVAMWPWPSGDRCGVPRLADAIAVDAARAERIGHQRRRHDDDLDIAVGVDAAGGKPVAQFVIVPRMRMHDAQSGAPAARPARAAATTAFSARAGAAGIEIGAARRAPPSRPIARSTPSRHCRRARAPSARWCGTASGVRPRLQAIGIGASMWATWKWPTASRSRIFAQEVSRTSVRSMPSASAKPFSLAATSSGAVEQRHEAGGDLMALAHGSFPVRAGPPP